MQRKSTESKNPISPSTSQSSLFNSQTEGKAILINKLNLAMIKMNDHIKKISRSFGSLRHELMYLRGAATFADPYQLNTINETINANLEQLEKCNSIRKAIIFLATISVVGWMANQYFFYRSNYNDRERNFHTMSLLHLIMTCSSILSMAWLVSDSSASTLSAVKSIKKIIAESAEDNRKLALLLNPNNPNELQFRKDFYEKVMLPEDELRVAYYERCF